MLESDQGRTEAFLQRHFCLDENNKQMYSMLLFIVYIHNVDGQSNTSLYLFITWDSVVKKLCKLSFVNSMSSFRKAGKFWISLESR